MAAAGAGEAREAATSRRSRLGSFAEFFEGLFHPATTNGATNGATNGTTNGGTNGATNGEEGERGGLLGQNWELVPSTSSASSAGWSSSCSSSSSSNSEIDSPDFDESRLPHLSLWFCKVPFYPQVVKELARAKHPTALNPSWCLGPVMKFVVCMPVIYAAVACFVVLISASAHTCDVRQGVASSAWLSFIWAPIGFALISAEQYILSYMSVSYCQMFKNKIPLPVFPVAFYDFIVKQLRRGGCLTSSAYRSWIKSQSFSIWHLFHLGTSVVRVYSFFNMNAFMGMAFREMWSPKKCGASGDAVEDVWNVTMHQSEWLSRLADFIPLHTIFGFMFAAEIAHFLVGVLTAHPGRNQWNDQGAMPLENVGQDGRRTWHQDFEFEVIEYLSHRDNDDRRPLGTRFIYVPVCFFQVTSKVAVQNVGEACGMTGIEKTVEASMNDDRNPRLRQAIEAADPSSGVDGVRKAMLGARGVAQDAHTVVYTLLSHVFLYGLCFCGLNIQLQVSYLNSRCFHREHNGMLGMNRGGCGSEPAPQVTGIVFGFLNIGLTILNCFKRWRFYSDTSKTFKVYNAWYQTRSAALHSMPEWTSQHLNQYHATVTHLQKPIFCWQGLIWPVSFALVLNFIWAVVKWYMTTYVCEDRMWNVPMSLDLSKGCVTLEGPEGQ